MRRPPDNYALLVHSGPCSGTKSVSGRKKMGVKGLWKLISPVGRRISLETLDGKVLAVDISVWITQFVKAMRDEEGNMTPQAHILGTLRRILKLLYHRIRPVFIFDGQTPLIKKNTTNLRRKFRDTGDQDKKALARKILLSQLRQRALRTDMGDTGAISSTFTLKRTKADNERKLMKDPFVANMMNMASVDVSAVPPPENDGNDVEWVAGYEGLAPAKPDPGIDIQPSNGNDEDEDAANWAMPANTHDIDVEVLASLPNTFRRSIIEEAARKDRSKRLSSLIPVANSPDLYSQTQLAHFLHRR
jgi:DNA excision repair protein ERCC-5